MASPRTASNTWPASDRAVSGSKTTGTRQVETLRAPSLRSVRAAALRPTASGSSRADARHGDSPLNQPRKRLGREVARKGRRAARPQKRPKPESLRRRFFQALDLAQPDGSRELVGFAHHDVRGGRPRAGGAVYQVRGDLFEMTFRHR